MTSKIAAIVDLANRLGSETAEEWVDTSIARQIDFLTASMTKAVDLGHAEDACAYASAIFSVVFAAELERLRESV